ncbi:hypothetical protein FVEN_g12127 [Fusarium venenatum]|uniref:Stress-response A/B barrel domain-containing protein n=1 Tax=Fusarium venenatum TaxID=56646 RepID=A0A2L2SPJ3_9HYPO|nr:uncharacterized protein FVRRES_11112 [Fusarium venenatum]KAG8349673.1 hypothetical protein FVEN_g12127 [Fusarium venenatum]KAH6977840.1 hypothetical protein EDB82DRAFT_525934 [Fusarium venenatum]CEI38421.1 unnamed protein product [Fusarium venenatum]
MSPVTRVTLFKVPSENDQQHLVDLYKQMSQKAVKEGKPYITSVQAGKASPDERAQGFTVVAISTFSSKADFDYYDTQCEAHLELKTFAKGVNQGFAMIYFNNEVI